MIANLATMTKQVKKIFENMMLGLFVVMAMSIGTTSCKKDKPPRAEITVVDSTGKAIDKARVVLFCVQRFSILHHVLHLSNLLCHAQ